MNIELITLRSLINKDNAPLNAASKKYLDSLIKYHKDLNFVQTSSSMKLFFIETGGSEIEFKKIYKSYQQPYYLLTSNNSNSLASALEILTFLHENNLKGEIIYGSAREVSETVFSINNAYRAIHDLQGNNLGIIGHPSDWLIGSDVSYQKAHDLLGVNLIDIPEQELIDEINKHNYDSNDYLASFDKLTSKKDVLKGALEIYGAIKRLINKYHLVGFTIRCFDLLSLFHNTSCLALAILNQEGYTATCEGDIPSFLSMHLARVLLHSSAFQANPAQISLTDNTVTFAHCTVPLDMVDSFKFMTHFESGLGIGIKGELRDEECTILKFNNELDDLYLNEGCILENLSKKNLCRTQIVVQLEDDIEDYLENPFGNHLIIVYGYHGYDFAVLMEILSDRYDLLKAS